MNITPKFIEECKKIQDLIEPEVGMLVLYHVPKEKNKSWGFIAEVDRKDRPLFRVRFYKGKCLETTHWFCKKDFGMTILPPLEWLMLKLAEKAFYGMEPPGDGYEVWRVITWTVKMGVAIKPDMFFSADTPSLACLLALIKVLGR